MESKMIDHETPSQEEMISSHRWLKIGLIVMFLLAALIRRYDIRAPGHLIEREYNSAIFARAFYLEHNDNVEAWQQDIAFAARDKLPLLEPPLTEYLVSLIYRITDNEDIWYARYLTGFFWLVGGIFLYKTVNILEKADIAVVATGYYLFIPWGIIISRSFQPDSLMMMMLLISVYCIVIYFKNPSLKRLIFIGVIAGLSMLLRPLIMFFLIGVFIALSIYKKEKWYHIFDRQLVIFLFLCILFPVIFYGYGIFISGSLQAQANLSFRPYLLARWTFWQGWFDGGAQVVGRFFLILAVLGFFLLRNNLTRFLVAGSAVGYLVFGIFFTFHVHTHPYYHIQLFPIISICIAPILTKIVSSLRKTLAVYWWIPVAPTLFLILYFSFQEVRGSFYKTTFEEPALAREIGEVVKHSDNTVFVAFHYGLPLEYYGEISGLPWPVRIDDPFYRWPDEKELTIQERLDGLGFVPEYFVITHFDLYRQKHQDLKVYLEGNCSIKAQSRQYLIYDNCSN